MAVSWAVVVITHMLSTLCRKANIAWREEFSRIAYMETGSLQRSFQLLLV